MVILGIFALLFFSLSGYSTGLALANRRHSFLPTLIDLITLSIFWTAVFQVQRTDLNHWLRIVCSILLGIMIGFFSGKIRRIRATKQRLVPDHESPRFVHGNTAAAKSPNIIGRLWRRWNKLAAIIGNIQVRLVMGFFYFIIVTPFGLITHYFQDPLKIDKSGNTSSWSPKQPTDTTIEQAREQG